MIKTYGVTITGDSYYEILANSVEEAKEIALSYWNEYIPLIETEVIEEEDEETIMLRANTMGAMNCYIDKLGDDFLTGKWLLVFPDECDEDELIEMAKNKDTFTEITNVFAQILRCAE